MSGSCDKHLTSSESLRPPSVRGMLSIRRLGRIESEEEEKMERKRAASNPLKHSPPQRLSLVNSATSGRFGFFLMRKKKEKSFRSCRQLVARTGSQLGWGGEGAESEVRE